MFAQSWQPAPAVVTSYPTQQLVLPTQQLVTQQIVLPPQQLGFPLQQPGFPPQQPGVPIGVGTLQAQPMNITCPRCRQNVVTKTTYEPGKMTWLICFGVSMVGGVCGCCVIPFCVDGCKDVRHTCPICTNAIGIFKRI